jgi:predicted transposase YdaD
MSAALYYRQEGKQEGRQEGRQERTFSIAKNMLHEGSEPSFIERVTGLPMEAIRGLQIA